MNIESKNIHIWLEKYGIKNENGDKLDFRDHPFMWEPYEDMSPRIAILKAAQIGFTTLAILKTLYVAYYKNLNIIYTLPTESDRNDFVSGKVNRIIAQNPIIQKWTKDKDSVEQKSVGQSLIYYRGTWSQKAAIMVSSDLNVYDEVDASKLDVIEQYSTRLQHSKYKWEWYFSHPSSPETGIDRYWLKSDQKHWFVTCTHCDTEHYLDWPDSIDIESEQFICKYCHGVLDDNVRRRGRWVAKYKEREVSGYWIPLLICPWVSAKEIVGYYNDKSEEYFYNKVLGKPYVGGGNKLAYYQFAQNLTNRIITPSNEDPCVLGLDTGTQLYYAMGTNKGLFYYSIAKDYDEIDDLMKRWKKLVVVADQGGDLIGVRALRERWPGRVYLCTFGTDRKTKELTRWGKGEEIGTVIADRNRCIQLVVDEFSDGRIPMQGTEEDWSEMWSHWNNLSRISEVDQKTGMIKRKIWVKNGQSDLSFATVYWRIGMMKFNSKKAELL